MSELYDIAIIGTGPAGLSAAITAKLRNKKIVLFGSESISKKVRLAPQIDNYLGIPHVSGQKLSEDFFKHIHSLGIEPLEKKVDMIYPMGKTFSLMAKNEIYTAKSVILATGIQFAKAYNGEEELLGKGVSYCASCDALFYKKKTVAVIASSAKEEEEVHFLSDIVEKIYFIPLYKTQGKFPANVEIIEDSIEKIEGTDKVSALVLKNQKLSVDGIFILRESVSPKQLLSGIALDENHIRVDEHLETSVKGCFACGDIIGKPYQYLKAAGEGNKAAFFAMQYLEAL